MALNFSEWKDSLKEPEYQVEGKDPKCPDGHKWDKKLQTCVPDTKNRENPGDKQLPDTLQAYNVWGASGVDGDGVAIAYGDTEPGPGVNESVYQKTNKDLRKQEEADKRHKEQDDRMRYGKKGKEYHEKTALRPGEVKHWDKDQNRWVSNKEGK